MDHQTTSGDGAPRAPQATKLSYKFQRLREKLRSAIASGELSGKLPGERQLAKRFRVNAKTLSKALTDLAAEGLLDRSIGRGTFVNDTSGNGTTTPSPHRSASDRWLILCDPDQTNHSVLRLLQETNPEAQVVTDSTSLRPSFLSGFKAVIDFSVNTSETLLRDLVVRGMTVVLVDREPSVYSMNAVVIDRALGASYLARDLLLGGHRQFFAVERRGQTTVIEAIRRAMQRYARDAHVEPGFAGDVIAAVERGYTAFICDSRRTAELVRDSFARRGIAIPGNVSLAAIGSGWGEYPCSGYFVHAEQKAQTVMQLLREGSGKRPTTLWLTGSYVDRGTTAPIAAHLEGQLVVEDAWRSSSALSL